MRKIVAIGSLFLLVACSKGGVVENSVGISPLLQVEFDPWVGFETSFEMSPIQFTYSPDGTMGIAQVLSTDGKYILTLQLPVDSLNLSHFFWGDNTGLQLAQSDGTPVATLNGRGMNITVLNNSQGNLNGILSATMYSLMTAAAANINCTFNGGIQ